MEFKIYVISEKDTDYSILDLGSHNDFDTFQLAEKHYKDNSDDYPDESVILEVKIKPVANCKMGEPQVTKITK